MKNVSRRKVYHFILINVSFLEAIMYLCNLKDLIDTIWGQKS